MTFLTGILSLCLAVRVGALPSPALPRAYNSSARPLVLWHGLGDSHSSPGMLGFMSLIREVHPDLFIHSVYVDEDAGKDQQAGYLGNVDAQVAAVAQQLAAVPALAARGFDALGFSQGGQFLRAFAERHNSPPVHNLVTFGAQHMGVADLADCRPFDLLCHMVKGAVHAGVYSDWAQSNIVPAQYYRDPAQLATYLAANRFLTSINNEIPGSRNETYAQNLRSLANLVMVLWTEDQTVVPRESSWFGSYAPAGEGNDTSDKTIVSMKQQPLYQEDWIGLKALDEAGRVKLISCEGGHMHLSAECWVPIVKQYVGGSWEGDANSTRYGLLVQSQ